VKKVKKVQKWGGRGGTITVVIKQPAAAATTYNLIVMDGKREKEDNKRLTEFQSECMAQERSAVEEESGEEGGRGRGKRRAVEEGRECRAHFRFWGEGEQEEGAEEEKRGGGEEGRRGSAGRTSLLCLAC
jgi:hypothetical protein